MRLLLAGTLATLTAAGLAAIPPAVLTDAERTAARAIRENRMRADVRFLSGDRLESHRPATPADVVARAYLAARFEAIGFEPGAPGGSWEQPLGGHDLDAPPEPAEPRDFRQVLPAVRVSLALKSPLWQRANANVIGRLPGRDPELTREAVVYEGVLDDASGLASMLAIAEAFAALPERPRRSILFATVPVADFGADGKGTGRHARLPTIGLGQPTLDDWIRAVAETQGRTRPTSLTAERDSAGAVEDARLLFHVGAKVANAPAAPAARPGDELEAARKKALAEPGR